MTLQFTLYAIAMGMTCVCAFPCPHLSTVREVFYNQLDIFDYEQGCGVANSLDQTALKYSGSLLDCGVDGNPQLKIRDTYTVSSTSFIKKVCMRVQGAQSVTINFLSLDSSPDDHVEDEFDDGCAWTRFCIQPGSAFDVWGMDISVNPIGDGSVVKIKGVIMVACHFSDN